MARKDATPRLSSLELRTCNISWDSPLSKGLKYLKILTPFENARPKLAVWLDALDEMQQLRALTLHSASPPAPPFPFDVERTVTLPSLTHLDISASTCDCALVLAHLNLPALNCICIKAMPSRLLNSGGVQNLLPYVARHANGPQDTRPLQSVLIRSGDDYAGIRAWPVPDIDVEVHDPPVLLGATLHARVTLSFNLGVINFNAHLEILEMVLAGLPLDNLVTLTAQDLVSHGFYGRDLSMQQFWHHLSPKWPLLQRVRLAPPAAHGFIEMLLEDNGGRERPVLPSLIELVVVNLSFYSHSLPLLCDALMKRVEQGVPLEMLDLRLLSPHGRAADWLRSLSEIVVDVLGPATFEVTEQMRSMWMTVARGIFVDNDNSSEYNHSDTSSDVEGEDDEE